MTSKPDKQKSSLNQFMMNHVFTPLAGVKLGDWLGILAHFGLKISPVYWPRTLFTLGMSCLNSLVSFLENLRYRRKLETFKKEHPVKAPVFVLGHHRSGTTHLLNLLSCDERLIAPNVLQAVFPHTFLTAESWIKPLASKVAMRKRPQDNVKFSVSEPIEEERAICAMCFHSIQMVRHFPKLIERFRNYVTMREATTAERSRWKKAVSQFANKLFYLHTQKHASQDQLDMHLLFKSPDHTGKIKLILDVFPDARFVHIHRDPFAVFRSTINMERKTDPLYQYQSFPEDELIPFILWRYKTMYEAYFEDSQNLPQSQHIDIAFEDLEMNPMAILEKVYDQLQLPSFEEVKPRLDTYLASIADYKKNTYQALPEELKQRVIEAWGFCFERWQYPIETVKGD